MDVVIQAPNFQKSANRLKSLLEENNELAAFTLKKSEQGIKSPQSLHENSKKFASSYLGVKKPLIPRLSDIKAAISQCEGGITFLQSVKLDSKKLTTLCADNKKALIDLMDAALRNEQQGQWDHKSAAMHKAIGVAKQRKWISDLIKSKNSHQNSLNFHNEIKNRLITLESNLESIQSGVHTKSRLFEISLRIAGGRAGIKIAEGAGDLIARDQNDHLFFNQKIDEYLQRAKNITGELLLEAAIGFIFGIATRKFLNSVIFFDKPMQIVNDVAAFSLTVHKCKQALSGAIHEATESSRLRLALPNTENTINDVPQQRRARAIPVECFQPDLLSFVWTEAG